MAATRRLRSVTVSSTSTVTVRAGMSTRADATPGRGASTPSIEDLQWSQWISGTLMVSVVMSGLPCWVSESCRVLLGLQQPLDRLGGLGHDRVAVGLAAGRVAHAVAQVVVQQ